MLGNCQGGKANTLLHIPNDALHIEFEGRNSEFNFTIAERTSNKKHMITRCKPVMKAQLKFSCQIVISESNIRIE